MADQSPRGNSFRAAVLRGERPQLLVEEKHPTLTEPNEHLQGELVSRTETRRENHRDGDRHRLTNEVVTVRYCGRDYQLELINLSGGGAMVRGDFSPRLWDMVEVEFGDSMSLEAAVRWVRPEGIGLEFAHETRLDCDSANRDELLRQVIHRSFPDAAELHAEQPPAPSDDECQRDSSRHPLIWRGHLRWAKRCEAVRLRNISAGGALVDVQGPVFAGTDLTLDLGRAGAIEATVVWAAGEQAGLKFREPFDITQLSRARPEVVPLRWEQPAYLKAETVAASPWAEQWNRMSLADLEGYLKR